MKRIGLALLALLAAGPALADAPFACQGKDLSADPALKVDRAAHAGELVNADGLLWRIDKDGVAPSFFYGTMHSTQPAAIALAREAAKHIDSAKAVATELGGPMDAADKVSLSGSLIAAALAPDRDTLAEAIPAAEIPAVEAYLANHGLPGPMAHHLKTWFLAATTSLPQCEADGEREGLPEVDDTIARIAKASHVPVIALETAAEQIVAISQTPADAAALLLRSAARDPLLSDDSYMTLLSLYLQKRPAEAIAVLDAAPGLTEEERAAEAAFTQGLLATRNETMIRRAGPLLAAGGAFIAVGALHLSGKEGLIERARTEGYKVTKVW